MEVEVEAFTIEMGSVEKRDPERVRAWPLNAVRFPV